MRERIYNEDGLPVAEIIARDTDGCPVLELDDDAPADPCGTWDDDPTAPAIRYHAEIIRRTAKSTRHSSFPDFNDEIPF
jgi:hypothetical protein